MFGELPVVENTDKNLTGNISISKDSQISDVDASPRWLGHVEVAMIVSLPINDNTFPNGLAHAAIAKLQSSDAFFDTV